MSLVRHIGVMLFTMVVTLLLPTEVAGMTHDTQLCYTTTAESDDAPEESCFTTSDTPLLSTPTTTVTPPSVIPVMRTLMRTATASERLFQHSKAVSAIDSTTAASRYGLYNHKILFYTLSRCYFMNRLMRLII